MQLTNSALSMLLKRYRAVLFKCRTLNWLGGTVLAAGLVLGAASGAQATLADENWVTWSSETEATNPATPDWQTKGLKIIDGANITLTDAHGYAGIALQMDGGTVTIAGGDGTSWYTPSLFGYGAEADANDATASATTLSGGTVNIVRGSFGAGLPGNGTQTQNYQFNIAGGDVNFQGAGQYDAVMLVSSTATAKTALAISDGAVTVAAGKFGAIDAPYGNVAVTGTGSLNAQGQLDIIAGGLAADGTYTPPAGISVTPPVDGATKFSIAGGGTLTVGSQGALNLHQNVALAVAADGVLRNAGTINVGVEGSENASLDVSALSNPLEALIGDGGSVVVAGTNERSALYVGDLAISTDQLAASRAAGKIALGPKGGISASGTLTLSGSTLALGVKEGAAGRLHAKTLTLADDITLAAGQIRLSGTSAALNGNLTLNNANPLFAELRLGSDLVNDAGAINGNVTAASGKVAVNNGAWTLATGSALDIAGGSSLAIGTESDTPPAAVKLDVQGTLTNAGTLAMGTGTLQASNGGHADLTQGTVTAEAGSVFSVSNQGHMKFSQANLDAALAGKVNIGANGLVSGESLALDGGILENDAPTAAGKIGFSGAGMLKADTLTISGPAIGGSTGTVGTLAANKMLLPGAGGAVTVKNFTLQLVGENAYLSNKARADVTLTLDTGATLVASGENATVDHAIDVNNGALKVDNGGSATFAGDVTVTKGTVTVAAGTTATMDKTLTFANDAGATGTIKGTLNVDGTNSKLVTGTAGGVAVETGGVVNATADALGLASDGAGASSTLGSTLNADAGSVINITDGLDDEISRTNATNIVTKVTNGTGMVNIGETKIEGVTLDGKGFIADNTKLVAGITNDTQAQGILKDVADSSDVVSAVAGVQLKDTAAGTLKYTGNTDIQLFGSEAGNDLVVADNGSTTGAVNFDTTNGTLTLGSADKANSGTLGKVDFGAGDATLNVLGNGEGGTFTLGAIDGTTDDKGTVTVKGTKLVTESIGATTSIEALNVSNGTVNSGAINTKGLTAKNGSTIAATGDVTIDVGNLELDESSVTGTGDFTSAGANDLYNAQIERTGDIDLSGGATQIGGATSSIAATGGDVTLGATTMNGGTVSASAKDDGSKGNVTVGALTAQSGTNSVTATGGDLTLGGAVTTADGASLALEAKGGNISATAAATQATSLKASAKDDGTGGNIDANGQNITAPVVQAGGTIDVNDLTAAGDPDAKDASVTATKLAAAGNVAVSNGALALTGTGADASTIGGTLGLNNVDTASVGDLTVTGAATITDSDFTANKLTAQNNVTVTNGAFSLTGAKDDGSTDSTVTGTLTLTDVTASVAGKLGVTGATTIDGGTFTGAGGSEVTYTGGATVKGGAAQTYDTLTVDNGLTVGAADDDAGTKLGVTALNLSGKPLTVGGADNAPAMVAVESFTNGADPAETKANGDITVNKNGQFSYGTADTGYAAQQMAVAAANGMDTAGVSSVFAVAGGTPLDMGGKDLTVGGTPAAGTAVIGANTLTIVSAAAAKLTDGAGGAVNIGANAADVGANAKLFIPDAQVGASYAVFATDNVTLDPTAWTGANLAGDNPLVTLARNDNGRINARLNSAGNVMPKLDPELVGAINAAAVANQIGTGERFVNSPEKGVRFLSRAISPDYLDAAANPDLAAQTIEGAARMVTIGAVPQMTRAANQAAGEAVTQRTSLAQPTGIQTQEAGDHFALWIMPLYQSVNGFGMEAGNFDADFNGGLGGVAIGADYTFENAIRAGITFNIGGGYATGGGDFADTTNSMNFWGIGAYAGWTKNNFGLSADVNFTSAYNKLEQDLPAAMDMRDLKADVRSYAFSTGLRGEYKLETDVLDIIPHVGVRYMYLSTEDYKVKSEGTVLKGDGLNQNIWTFPVGVSFSKSIDTGNGWHFKPMVDLSVIPAAGDIKAKENVRFTGTDTQAELETQIMDYISYQGGLGFEVGNENLAFGVNGNVQFGAKTSGYGVLGTFRYEF